MKWLIVLLSLFTLPLLSSSSASAQNSPSTITVEPASLDFEVATGDEQVTIVTITNQYDSEVSLIAELKGIDSVAGRIIPSGDVTPSLASSLRLSETQFSIPPLSKYFLTVSLADSDQLTPGGHYGTLVLTNNSEEIQNSSVQPQLSVGVFVVKEQGAVAKVELTKHEFARKRFQFPTSASIELINDGDVHLVPRGYVRVYDQDFVYYETVLNTQSKVILPTKRYMQDLSINTDVSSWLPKKITIELGYRADGIEETKLHMEAFWYVPWHTFPLAILSIGTLIYVILTLRTKLFKR